MPSHLPSINFQLPKVGYAVQPRKAQRSRSARTVFVGRRSLRSTEFSPVESDIWSIWRGRAQERRCDSLWLQSAVRLSRGPFQNLQVSSRIIGCESGFDWWGNKTVQTIHRKHQGDGHKSVMFARKSITEIQIHSLSWTNLNFRDFFGTANPYADLLTTIEKPPRMFDFGHGKALKQKEKPFLKQLLLKLEEVRRSLNLLTTC